MLFYTYEPKPNLKVYFAGKLFQSKLKLKLTRSFSPYSLRISLRIQSECGKIRTRKIPKQHTFHAKNLNVKTILLIQGKFRRKVIQN